MQQLAGEVGRRQLESRTQATAGRFDRLGGLPLPRARRLLVVAASGVQAATYGEVAGTPTREQVAKLRTAAGRAVWRGGRYGAVELRLLLGALGCRSDPVAAFAIAPLAALATALRNGWVHVADVCTLSEAPVSHPLASALSRSFSRLHLSGSLLCWQASAVGDHPGGDWWPPRQGLTDTLAWLRRRWRALAAQAVAVRRPHFWEARLGIDWLAAERALATVSSPPRQASARAAMVGDSATATRASHWATESRACPHCAAPEETVEHQLWVCPWWHGLRVWAAAAFAFDIDTLVPRLGPLTLHALLRPPCLAAQASARLWETIPRASPPPGPAREGGGNCVDGRGCLPRGDPRSG